MLAVVLCASSCRDECDWNTFEVTCEGNTLVSCPAPGVDQIVPVRIRRQDCEDKFCVASAKVCALSSSPEPLCADAGTQACETPTSRLYCSSGFATSRTPCRTCDGGTCEGGPSARCSGDSDCATELRCGDAGFCRNR